MLKYKDNARGLLNSRLSAQQELFMFENYGFENTKRYTLDVLSQNLEYCTVLECETHDEQIQKVIDFLELSNNADYIKTLKDFSTKNGNNWYIPVDRLINWIDCYMIQKEVFFKYAASNNSLLFAPHYFTDNVLLMIVNTDNTDENFDNDLDEILSVYDTLVKGIANILKELPSDKLIENLFTMTDEQREDNVKQIDQLAKEYTEYVEKSI